MRFYLMLCLAFSGQLATAADEPELISYEQFSYLSPTYQDQYLAEVATALRTYENNVATVFAADEFASYPYFKEQFADMIDQVVPRATAGTLVAAVAEGSKLTATTLPDQPTKSAQRPRVIPLDRPNSPTLAPEFERPESDADLPPGVRRRPAITIPAADPSARIRPAALPTQAPTTQPDRPESDADLPPGIRRRPAITFSGTPDPSPSKPAAPPAPPTSASPPVPSAQPSSIGAASSTATTPPTAASPTATTPPTAASPTAAAPPTATTTPTAAAPSTPTDKPVRPAGRPAAGRPGQPTAQQPTPKPGQPAPPAAPATKPGETAAAKPTADTAGPSTVHCGAVEKKSTSRRKYREGKFACLIGGRISSYPDSGPCRPVQSVAKNSRICTDSNTFGTAKGGGKANRWRRTACQSLMYCRKDQSSFCVDAGTDVLGACANAANGNKRLLASGSKCRPSGDEGEKQFREFRDQVGVLCHKEYLAVNGLLCDDCKRLVADLNHAGRAATGGAPGQSPPAAAKPKDSTIGR